MVGVADGGITSGGDMAAVLEDAFFVGDGHVLRMRSVGGSG